MWLSNKDITVIVQAGPKAADLPFVPSIEDVIPDPDNRKVVELLVSGTRLGRPLATTPGVPEERVKALRDAYAAMLQDPEYLKDVTAARLDPNPIRGEDLAKTVNELMAMPQAVKARGKKLIE
jgi:hypothetical protein